MSDLITELTDEEIRTVWQDESRPVAQDDEDGTDADEDATDSDEDATDADQDATDSQDADGTDA